MYFRCPTCRAATWHDDEQPVRPTEELSCGGCGKVLVARPVPALGPSTADHFRSMIEASRDLGVDAASAYSFLLGLLTLDELRGTTIGPTPEGRGPAAVQHTPAPARPPAAPAPVPAPELVAVGARALVAERAPASGVVAPSPPRLDEIADYDPGFRAAVLSGRLTVQDAALRGDREAFVASLVARHALTRSLACGVADNRINLLQALASRPPETAPTRTAPPRSRRRLAKMGLVGSVALAALAAVTYWASERWERSFPPPPRPQAAHRAETGDAKPHENATFPAAPPDLAEKRQAATVIKRNDVGEITEIVGPDPAAVLVAFCESRRATGSFEPLEITETVPRLVEARLGLFRDAMTPDVTQAVWMRKDHRTRRWVAGDGKHPIPVRTAPAFPPDAYREPVVAPR